MAAGPWRCSQCGTINEPVANSCRTCGRWPSLFDLQDSVVDEADLEAVHERAAFEHETFDPEAVEPDVFQPETFQTEPFDPTPVEPEVEGHGDTDVEETRRAPRWVSWLVPLALVAYFAISFFFSDR
jgi:hypothetical protein